MKAIALPPVLMFMREHAGVPYHIDDVAGQLNLASNAVGNVLSATHLNPKIPIERVGKGIYMYSNGSKPKQDILEVPFVVSPELYEHVGKVADGRIIIRDASGTLYILTEL